MAKLPRIQRKIHISISKNRTLTNLKKKHKGNLGEL